MARWLYAVAVIRNADLAEALFQLAESHPPGEERLGLLRAAYAVFDAPRELAGPRRLPEAIPLETLPTVALLRSCASRDTLTAAVGRLSGPHRPHRAAARDGFLSTTDVQALLASSYLEAGQLRGAAHWHTRNSDGAAPLEMMARTCLRRGYSWAVVADHSRGLACVNGLDAEGMRLQRGAIEGWNVRHGDDLRVLPGLEAEILEDGRLDLPRAERDGVLVIASIHSGLAERRDATNRILTALDEPGVWALGHPQGRLFARRTGIRANWEVVFAAAAERGVLVEINGFPRRQDLDEPLSRLALAAGCRFLLASDAHHPRHLGYDATALAIATAAGVPRDAIVNFDSLDRLLDPES